MSTTWNPEKISRGCSIGGGGLTFVCLDRFSEEDHSVVARDGAESGLRYCELTIHDGGLFLDDVWVGLVPENYDPIDGMFTGVWGNQAAYPSAFPGNSGFAVGTGGSAIAMGVGLASIPAFQSSVLRMATNHTTGLVWVAVDGGAWFPAGGDPVAGTDGFDIKTVPGKKLFPCAYIWRLGGVRANFGATPYLFTPPAGALNYGG